MKKWNFLDEEGNLTLHERDGDYLIRVDGIELMSTRRYHSEQRLAEIACEGLGTRARVLIGGLGFGYTKRAASAILPKAEIVIAEMSPAIIRWNRRIGFTDDHGHVIQRDVAHFFHESWDAIILDVDNGPTALTNDCNHDLYTNEGLRTMTKSLNPGGRLAVWSIADDAAFAKRMRGAGLEVATHKAYAHAKGGGRHTIFLGRKAARRD